MKNNILLSTKLKNEIIEESEKKPSCTVEVFLKNIRVNGDTRGCSGFARCVETGGVVYMDTEHSVYGPISDKSLYRYAASTKDYSSNSLINGQNRFCLDNELAENVVNMLYEGIGQVRRK
jgi:hypothetical protein